MIFVSYSHNDRRWFRRFMRMAKPLQRYANADLWSDVEIKAGEMWSASIQTALDQAKIAVLLVSDAFLDSDFIMQTELPFLLKARQEHDLQLFWVALSPCLYKLTPLAQIQAVGKPEEPLNKLDEYAYKKIFCELCEKIDTAIRTFETPVINLSLDGKSFQEKADNLQILSKEAFRDTEVLLYSDDNAWYVQPKVKKGTCTTTCWIGDHTSKPGTVFKIVTMTCSDSLKQSSRHISLPEHRTKSREITVKRR